MKTIELTNHQTGNPIAFNTKHIVTIMPAGNGARIFDIANAEYIVEESYNEIMRVLRFE